MNLIRWTGAILLAAASSASAQEAAAPTVTVAAAGKVEKSPTALQFSFQLVAKGDDVAKAIEALEAKRKSTAEKLKALGVAEKDIQVGSPTLERRESNDARAAMRKAASNRLKKKKEDEKVEKDPVMVSFSMTARLPLSAKEKAAIFVESVQLKEKVKAAKLIEREKKAGEGEPDEDDELAARLAAYQEQEGMEEGFMFQFFADSDPKDSQVAAARAMENARKLAEIGARASGKTLGAPTNIEINESGSGASSGEDYVYYERRFRGGMGIPRSSSSEGLVSSSLEGLASSVTLKVTFSLK